MDGRPKTCGWVTAKSGTWLVDANILYQRNTVGYHSTEYANGRPAALAWLNSVLGGTYSQDYSTTGCTTEVVTVNVTSSTVIRRSIEGGTL